MGEAQILELAASTRRTRNGREEVSQRKWQSPCQKRNQDKYSRRPHTKTTQPFMLHEIGFKKEQSQNFLQNVFYFRFKEQGRGSQTRASCPISYFPNCIFSEKACLWSNQELCQATTKMVCFPIVLLFPWTPFLHQEPCRSGMAKSKIQRDNTPSKSLILLQPSVPRHLTMTSHLSPS